MLQLHSDRSVIKLGIITKSLCWLIAWEGKCLKLTNPNYVLLIRVLLKYGFFCMRLHKNGDTLNLFVLKLFVIHTTVVPHHNISPLCSEAIVTVGNVGRL